MFVDGRDLGTINRRHHTGGTLDMFHRPILQIQDLALFVTVGDFQDEGSSIFASEEKIPIPLTGKLADKFRKAVQPFRDPDGICYRNLGCKRPNRTHIKLSFGRGRLKNV